MESRTMISVEEYLRTSYRPDCDYVDGEVRERLWGELDHSKAQAEMLWRLAAFQEKLGLEVLPSLRLRVSETRIRIPDVCVFLGDPGEQVPRTPPFLCVEIVSPADAFMRLNERIDDYLAMGVSYVWVVNPATRRAFAITPDLGWREVKDGVLRTQSPALEVPLEEIFGSPVNLA